MTDLLFVKWILAFSPIAVVLILMIGFHWGGGRAGAAGWFTALIVSVLFFGADARLLAFAQMKGVLLALYVLYIIWMALILYNVVDETGAIEVIGTGIKQLTADKPFQLLILGWVFASFLQGVAGFGVPIAVVGPLLLGMGFPPLVAVAVPAIGHSWSVTYGDMASSFQALIAVTGLSGDYLAHWSSIFLGVTVFMCGLAVVHLYGGFAAVRRSLLAIVIVGSVMAATQYALAVSGLWTLAGFVAGMVGIVTCILVSRLPMYRRTNGDTEEAPSPDAPRMSLTFALSAYFILIAIVAPADIIDPLRQFLGTIKLSLMFPEITTGQGWVNAAGYGKKINIFGHPGALLLYTSVVSYFVYASRGCYKPGAVRRIWTNTVKSGVSTSIGIVSMVCFALMMSQSGMTNLLAEGISKVFGQAYPLFAGAIGTLGAFMTGSNTNSNVVFAQLQLSTAELAALSVPVILAAQTTGGSIGSMLAPAKILVGCSTVGLAGKEGPVLARTITYGLIMTAIIGVLALIFGAG
ncbi:MAG: L-lactate permease [Rhodospirillales bacterium]|nr:L-lactate permease [Rhodospirillales bacterium]